MPCRNVSGSDLGRTALWKGDLSKWHAPALQKTDCVPLRRPYRNASRAIDASYRVFEVLGPSMVSLSGLRGGGQEFYSQIPSCIQYTESPYLPPDLTRLSQAVDEGRNMEGKSSP